MNTFLKRIGLISLLLLSLPILLHVYNPSMQLGFLGLILGILGLTVSPIILFGALLYLISQFWNSPRVRTEK